jgi:hypothetical protein
MDRLTGTETELKSSATPTFPVPEVAFLTNIPAIYVVGLATSEITAPDG